MYFSQNTKIEFSEPSYHLDCVFFLCGDCALLILTIQVRMTRRNLCRDIYGCGGQGWGGSVEDKHGQCTYVTVSAWHTRLDLTKLSRSYSTCSDGADSTNFCRLWSGVNFSLWPFYVSTTRLDRRVPWPSMQHHILDTAIFLFAEWRELLTLTIVSNATIASSYPPYYQLLFCWRLHGFHIDKFGWHVRRQHTMDLYLPPLAEDCTCHIYMFTCRDTCTVSVWHIGTCDLLHIAIVGCIFSCWMNMVCVHSG
jgi:hypothetical protein